MQRRKFMQRSLLAGSAVFTSATVMAKDKKHSPVADDKPFHLNYGIHDGMFKNNAGPDFIEQIKFGYDHGFRAIEDNGMSKRTPEDQQKIGDALAKMGMAMGVFVLDKGGNGANTLTAGKAENVEIFLKGCRNAVEVSKRCG